jgi:hypothetical protein
VPRRDSSRRTQAGRSYFHPPLVPLSGYKAIYESDVMAPLAVPSDLGETSGGAGCARGRRLTVFANVAYRVCEVGL